MRFLKLSLVFILDSISGAGRVNSSRVTFSALFPNWPMNSSGVEFLALFPNQSSGKQVSHEEEDLLEVKLKLF